MLANWVIGLLISTLIIVFSYAILYFYSGYCYEKIDKDLLKFLNVMSSYSKSNDDIVSIMGKTYPYLNYPLNKYIEDFYNEATSTGDMTRAFRKLEYKIENQKARELIRNLEICSRHEANYQEIINDQRNTIIGYLKAKQQRKSITSSGRLEILFILVLSIIILIVFSSFTHGMFDRLLNSNTGKFILIYCVIVLGITLFNMVNIDRG